ncbi:MAG TPA: SulP family inorganic anion transporter [Clostridia bacterium]|nr:SulP family inorganic anion transporter [Clostridia bacterium]
MESWLPKSLLCLSNYSRKDFFADLLAGVTVGMVALPLAMAFAIASGLSPQSGIYCAVVTGFIISAFGGSRVQIGGPTGAFVVVIAAIVARHGVDGLFMCTMMAGVLLLAMGVTGLGSAVKFIPRPVVLGFTNGIAVLIASTQIKDFFGLQVEHVPSEFIKRIRELALQGSTASWQATVLAISAVAIILLCSRFMKRVPGYIVVLVLGTAAVVVFRLPVETIGSRFGGIPSGMPHLKVPQFRPDLMLTLISPAVTIAMLGAIESLMSAVVADRMSGDRHNPNVELMAQGIANIASPIFGGLPATGAIARTATNVRSGARTPVAGIVHALTLVLILLFAAPLARFIPLAVLAAILLVVAYNMGEWGETAKLLKLSRYDIAVWVVTFGLTVVADLTVAVEFGMILAALLFIRKVTETTTVTEVTEEYVENARPHILQDKDIPAHVSIFRIHGPFLFGATEKLAIVSDSIPDLPHVVILRLRNMTALDATGLHEIAELADRLHASGRVLILCGARQQPAALMRKAEFAEKIGRKNICFSIEQALARARDFEHQGIYEA